MDRGMGALYFILFVISIFWIMHRRLAEKQVLMLLFAIVIPFLVLTALSNKGDRYIVPVFPFAALLTSRMLLEVRKKYIWCFMHLDLLKFQR